MINTLPKSLIEASRDVINISLYESFILTEDRIDFLKEKNPVIDTSHDHLAIFNHPHEIIDHFANVGDPTKNKTHTQWILGQYKKQNIRQEDMHRVRSTLENFEKYKSKLPKKDINQYKSIADVENAVHPHIGTASSKAEEKQIAESKGRTLIHSDDKIKVYRLEHSAEGKKASQDIYGGGHELGGTHTSWCTAARSANCMFDYYSKENSHLHVIHTKDGSVYQAHPETSQLMDSRDEPVYGEHVDDANSDLVKHKHADEISSGLDHIPDGWKLKIKFGLPGVSKKDIETAVNQTKDTGLATTALEHPNTTSDILEKASTHEDGNIRATVAKHPNTPKNVLKKLFAFDKSPFVRENVAENPSNSSKELLDMYNDSPANHNIRLRTMRHPNASVELLDKGITDESPRVMSAAVSHPNATPEILRKSVEHWHGNIHDAVSNPNATPDIIDKALDNKGWQNQYTRYAAIKNPNASVENITKAMNDDAEGVRRDAVSHPNATAEHLFKGMNDTYVVAGAAMNNPNATPEHIQMGINSEYGTIQFKALNHPNVTKTQLDDAIKSNNTILQAAAARNPNLTKEQITHLKNLNHPQVTQSLRKNIKFVHHEMDELGL